MTTIRMWGLVIVLALLSLPVLMAAPGVLAAAPLAAPLQQTLLFDQEYPLSIALDDGTPQLSFTFPCAENTVASVHVETISGDLAVEASIAAPDGALFAAGTQVSSDPNVTAAEAFIAPATGTCVLTLNRVGATAGRAELRLLSGYARLNKWDTFDGVKSPLRMSWEPYSSDNMDVRVSPDQELVVHVIAENLLAYAVPVSEGVTWDDFYIEADFVIDGAPTYFEYGFVFNVAEDAETFYSATLSSDGDYSVYYYNGEWTAVQNWTVSSVIDAADKQPHMGLWVQGSTYRLYFNDQLVGEVNDTQLFATQGELGLAAATGPDQTDSLTVSMDNVVITTPVQGTAAATTLPFGGDDSSNGGEKPTPASGLSSGLFGGGTKEPTPKPPPATLPPIAVPTQPPARPTSTPEPVQGLVLENWSSSEPDDVLDELRDYGLIPAGGSMQINVPSSYGDTSSSGFSFFPLGRGKTFHNFVLSFDARLVSTGPESGCGMYFRSNNSYSNSALVFEDASALLGEWDASGDLSDTSFFDYADVIQGGQGATNRVHVVAFDETVLMYVNGELLAGPEFADETGEIALEMYVAEDDAGQTQETYCQLNNIWLWEF